MGKLLRVFSGMIALALVIMGAFLRPVAGQDAVVGIGLVIAGLLLATSQSRRIPMFFALWALRESPEVLLEKGRWAMRIFGILLTGAGAVGVLSGARGLM